MVETVNLFVMWGVEFALSAFLVVVDLCDTAVYVNSALNVNYL